jgi:undecaprenyl-diphosphatase
VAAVDQLVRVYGLPVLFLGVMLESAGVPVPGETALIAASVLASLGLLPLPSVIGVATVAAILGDNLGYWIGRAGGRYLLERWRPDAGPVIQVAEGFFARHGGKAVFLGRFVTGLRVVGALLAGIARMEWWHFLLWNTLGGFVWATSVALLGYSLGAVALGAIGHYGLLGGAVLIAGGAALYGLAHWLRGRWSRE